MEEQLWVRAFKYLLVYIPFPFMLIVHKTQCILLFIVEFLFLKNIFPLLIFSNYVTQYRSELYIY
jgi:hypothetical protein